MIADVFNSNIFSVQSMTDAVNKLPYAPSRIAGLNIFSTQGVATTSVIVESRDGLLTLLPTRVRGGPANESAAEKRKARSFLVPHIPYQDTVMADDLQNVRAFGRSTELEVASQVVNDRLTRMRQEHEITLEHLRIGALKGQILDADGTSVIYNLFTEFGISQTSISFDLDEDTTKVRLKCLEAKRHIEEVLGASVYTSIHAFCGHEFFDALISHPDIEKAYDRWQAGEFLRTDPRAGFPFAGITWEEYRGTVNGVDFIPADEAIIFPLGVPNLFRTYFAPADFMETANTIGLPLYAKQRMLDFDRGVQVHTQSNPLPICVRPGVLIRATVDDD